MFDTTFILAPYDISFTNICFLQMANERTFLSWIRTSMGLATCGVGITQLFKLNTQHDDSHDEFLSRIGRPIGGEYKH